VNYSPVTRAIPAIICNRTFAEVGGYYELMVLKNIRVLSFCEHHMLPVIGRAHVGYPPTNRVVGISKLAQVVHWFARRLQIQEKLTAEIAETIQEILELAESRTAPRTRGFRRNNAPGRRSKARGGRDRGRPAPFL